MINKATIRKILDTADIVEVVGDYVHLTKRGSNYMGLCPFHNERTPSFSVSPSRGICHCFSCGKGGSPVNFIMEKEGINFHDAIMRLAQKYGIKIEERELSDAEREAESQRESVYVLHEWVAQEMQHALTETKEGRDIGLQYLYSRGVTDQAIEKFRIGYSPDSFTAIYNKAVNSGFETELLIKSGICGRSSNGKIYDRFKGRIMFPIMTTAGRIIAFGGRGIKGEPAKYVNSPETPIYTKSNELYGISQARNAISKQNKCYLVEGYLDVIGMWQSGLENTIASSGTSLTDGQISLIHRFAKNVTLIYDGDPAGIKASLRGIDLLLRHGLNIKVVRLPDGEDPDSFSHKMSPEDFRSYISKHETDFIRFKTRILLDQTTDDPIQRSEAVQSVVTSLAAITDQVKRTVYVQDCSRLLNITESVLLNEISKIRRGEETNIRKRLAHQEIERKQLEYEKIKDKLNNQSIENDHVNQSEDNISKQEEQIFAPFELEVLRYCIRYGMTEFCERVDENGNVSWMNVVDFVNDELSIDNVQFKNALYYKVFQRLIDIKSEYYISHEKYQQELKSKANDKRKLKVETLAENASGNVDQLTQLENEINKEIEDWERFELTKFSQEYAARELISDRDDEIRILSTDLIVERYQLSKYHTKCGLVESEFDRLPELLPRAITEWKAKILDWEYQQLQQKLHSLQINSPDEQMKLIERMQKLQDMRSDIAKQTGERIISP